MAIPNPNYPLVSYVADFTQGPPSRPGANQMSLNAPARRTAVRKASITRGRQYELDQVQSGTATLTIADPLENLHPSNGSSPFNTGGNTITSYRCMQIGAWWNPSTQSVAGNFLSPSTPIPSSTVSSTWLYDPTFENWFVSNGTTSGATYATSTDHLDGSHTVWKVTVNSNADSVAYFPRIVAGVTYTIKLDLWAATGLVVQFGWTGSTSTSVNVTGNNAFQSVTLTFTPNATDAAGGSTGYLYLYVPSAGSYPQAFYVSNFQLAGLLPGWSLGGGAGIGYSTDQAHSGQSSAGINVTASTDTASLAVPTVPGITYTMSGYAYALNSGTTATMSIGASSVSTSTVNAWQRLSLTFVAVDAVTQVVWKTTASAYTAHIYVDDIQLEVGSSASTFTTSGPTYYPLYTGYVERFPLQWDMQGTRGIRPLTCVDALSILSRTEISQSYKAAILADGPNLFMPYNDQSIPQVVQLPQGGQPFLGYQNLGTQGTVNFQGDTFLDGTPAVSVSQQNTNPPTFFNNSQITYLGTSSGFIYMNPQAFTIEVWAKIEAGEPYFGAGAVPATEQINTEPFGPAKGIGWYTFLGGRLGWNYQDPNGTVTNGLLPGYSGYPDGKWHYFAIKLIGGNGLTVALDNFIGGVATITPSKAVQLNNFYVDAQAYYGDPVTTIAVANMACYPYALSNAQLANHYNMGTGYLGELPGARVARFLGQYWGGPTNVAAGKRQLAPDNASGSDYNARFVLDVLQEIQETERGLVYASAAGVVTFEDSTTRYTSNLTSKWVFGENPPGASPVEYPYSALEEGFDPTYTFSQTNLTRPGNSSFAPLPNPLPTNPPYGQRVLSQQVQVNTDFDLVQASTFYLKRYGAPTIRVEKLTLNPAGNPALWPVILSLEISQRITVKRRTSAGLTTSADYYIEQISHNIDGDAGTWTVDLQCSPVFNNSAWILGDSTYGVLGSTTIPVY